MIKNNLHLNCRFECTTMLHFRWSHIHLPHDNPYSVNIRQVKGYSTYHEMSRKHVARHSATMSPREAHITTIRNAGSRQGRGIIKNAWICVTLVRFPSQRGWLRALGGQITMIREEGSPWGQQADAGQPNCIWSRCRWVYRMREGFFTRVREKEGWGRVSVHWNISKRVEETRDATHLVFETKGVAWAAWEVGSQWIVVGKGRDGSRRLFREGSRKGGVSSIWKSGPVRFFDPKGHRLGP